MEILRGRERSRIGDTMKALIVLFVFLILDFCASADQLGAAETSTAEVTGAYTLILHGGRFNDDIENAAILDREGDQYTFEIFAADFDYVTRRGVPAREAFEESEKFVAFHHAFRQSQLKKIMDDAGKTIGYEVRPLYSPLDFGFSDVLDVSYQIKNGKVTVFISLKPEVEQMFIAEK